MRTKHTFKAYSPTGELVLSTWTSVPATYAAECDAYQARLNRYELGWVTVASSDPKEPDRQMRAQGNALHRNDV